MPKANLRSVSGTRFFEVFECSICKTKCFGKFDIQDPQSIADHKADIFMEWDAHLFISHRRQWDFQQAKNAKRKAAQIAKVQKDSKLQSANRAYNLRFVTLPQIEAP